jgi:hypothetical protein
VAYSQVRKTFGKPICEHQAIQLKLGEMATRTQAARLLVYAAAEAYDRGERCDMEAGMAKYFATEAGQENALEAMRIFGGYGYSKEYNVERPVPRRAPAADRRRHQRAAAHHHRQATDREEPGVNARDPMASVTLFRQRGRAARPTCRWPACASSPSNSTAPAPSAPSTSRTSGAEVIKIENPNEGGDVGRVVGPAFLRRGRQPLLPVLQPQQEEHHAGPEEAGGPRGAAPAGEGRRRGVQQPAR